MIYSLNLRTLYDTLMSKIDKIHGSETQGVEAKFVLHTISCDELQGKCVLIITRILGSAVKYQSLKDEHFDGEHGKSPLKSDYYLDTLGATRQVEGLPGGSDSKDYNCNAGNQGSIPGLERSPGGGNGNPLQYSFLENSMGRTAWQATIHGFTKSQT